MLMGSVKWAGAIRNGRNPARPLPDTTQTGPEIFLEQVRQEFWGLGLMLRAFGFGV